MAKHNVVKKAKRAETRERKRALHANPATGKLRQKQDNSIPISGKRKRKLFKKWRREQKEALRKGLVTMEDVEMAVAEGTSQGSSVKSQTKFQLKRGKRLRVKNLKSKGKSTRKPFKLAARDSPVDAMQE